jgi:hypothetical protein
MKKELIACNLLKHGTAARDDTIRTLYMAMKEVGTITNTSLTTQWHNYTADQTEDETAIYSKTKTTSVPLSAIKVEILH